MSSAGSTGRPTALVLDGHTGAAVEALQSLARLGVEVDVAGPEGSLAFESRRARHAFHQPGSDVADDFISWLRELDDRGGYALIVPADDNAVFPFSTLSDADPLRQKAVLPSSRALKVAQDKSRTLALAGELGVATARTQLIEWLDAAPPAARFPLVLTPAGNTVYSSGRLRSFQPVLVNNDEQRQAQLSYLLRHVPVLEHEFVPGQSWGITLLYARGERKWHFAHQRLHELSLGGICSYRRSAIAPDAMLRDATRMLDALEWHGVATVEFVRTEDGRCLLSCIHPTLGDPLALIIDAGMDLPAGLLRLATHDSLPPQPAYAVPHATRSLRRDATWIMQRLRAGDTVEALAELVKAACPWLVRESWDHFDWNDLGVTGAVLRGLWDSWWGGMEERLEMRTLEALARQMHQANLQQMLASGRPPRRLLFLCYGNICRSPVAAALAQRAMPGAKVASAGFFAIEGRRSPDNIRWAAGRMGLDTSHWGSRLVSDEMVADADAIFIMDLYNLSDFRTRYAKHLHKVLLLGMFADPPSLIVRDPYQKGPEETIHVLRQIERAVAEVSSVLVKADAADPLRITVPPEFVT